MQVVIDIDEEDYKYVKEVVQKEEYALSKFYYTIANGTVLPKGHGRLIDVDKFIDALFAYGQADDKFKLGELIKYTPSEIWEIEKILAKTVIEADREVENESPGEE